MNEWKRNRVFQLATEKGMPAHIVEELIKKEAIPFLPCEYCGKDMTGSKT